MYSVHWGFPESVFQFFRGQLTLFSTSFEKRSSRKTNKGQADQFPIVTPSCYYSAKQNSKIQRMYFDKGNDSEYTQAMSVSSTTSCRTTCIGGILSSPVPTTVQWSSSRQANTSWELLTRASARTSKNYLPGGMSKCWQSNRWPE